MWHLAAYRATTLFSLRPANATVSGGKTLLVPTPFSLKMALLDAAIRLHGKARGKRWFQTIRDLSVAVLPPQHIVVNKTFVRIQRPNKGNKPQDNLGTGIEGILGSTIAYREMAFYNGEITLAFSDAPFFPDLLAQIHYLGKRGGFFQLTHLGQSENIPSDFTLLNGPEPEFLPVEGTLQLLDDCGTKMTFEHADIYADKNIRVGTHRLLNVVVLPMRVESEAHDFTLYRRTAG
jgi:hypothetical protein